MYGAASRRSGQRLVGAAKADHANVPFIVAWTLQVDEKNEDADCTGQLLKGLCHET
jgi:Holliday junction resolvasome RuvABC endonuclease subunit